MPDTSAGDMNDTLLRRYRRDFLRKGGWRQLLRRTFLIDAGQKGEERFHGAFQKGAFPSWRSKVDGAKCAQSEAAQKSEGSLGRPSLGLARAPPRWNINFRTGKALAVMAGCYAVCYAGAKGSMPLKPSMDSGAAPSAGGILHSSTRLWSSGFKALSGVKTSSSWTGGQ